MSGPHFLRHDSPTKIVMLSSTSKWHGDQSGTQDHHGIYTWFILLKMWG